MFNRALCLAERLMGRWISMAYQLKIQNLFSLLRVDVLGPHVEAVLVNSYNGRLLVPAEDLVVGRMLAFQGVYDRVEIETLSALLNDKSEVLVVGTHVGSILIPLAKKAARVAGVEANPRTFDLLSANLLLNGITNVELHNVAAGHETGEVSFLANRHNSGGSKVKWSDLDRGLYCYDHPAELKVPLCRLDNLFSGRRFDLILLDIEGSEYFALRGMRRILESCHRLYVEISRFGILDVAHVSPEVFAGTFADLFESARVMEELADPMPRSYSRDQFASLIRRLCEAGRTFNVLFEKDHATS